MANNLLREQRRTSFNINNDKISVYVNRKQIKSLIIKLANKPFTTIAITKREALLKANKFHTGLK
jgi:hypothetical protein